MSPDGDKILARMQLFVLMLYFASVTVVCIYLPYRKQLQTPVGTITVSSEYKLIWAKPKDYDAMHIDYPRWGVTLLGISAALGFLITAIEIVKRRRFGDGVRAERGQ